MEKNNITKTLTAGLNNRLVCEILDYQRDYVGKQFDTIVGIHQWSKEGHWCLITEGGAKPSFDRVKPLLFPMSSLTKEIEFKGERFVPIDKIAEIVEDVWFNDDFTREQFWYEIVNGIWRPSFEKSQKINDWLIEHHFNVFNLSPEEFVEVNETNNPYR